MLKDKLLNTITALLFIVGAGCILWVLYKNWSTTQEVARSGNLDCVKARNIEVIKDPHMAALIPDGSNVQVLMDYYQCNSIGRDHQVWFKFSENIKPVVRIVKGIPGDRYEVQKLEDEKWSLRINSQPIKTADGQDYFLQAKNIPPLKTYEISRKGLLRENEYILLSSNPPGLTDSSNLGLISPQKIVGRVLPVE